MLDLQREYKLANKTVGHIKQMNCNPVEEVEWSAETDYKSIVVTPQEAQAILEQLHQPESTLLLLVTCTGMRCSEALGLKWGRH